MFQTLGGCYLYDVNKNIIINIDNSTYSILLSYQKSSYDIDSLYSNNSVIKKLMDNGFLSSKRISKIFHPSTDKLSYMFKNNLQMITLQVTQNCNLRCKYCVYSGGYNNRHHIERKMDFDMAKRGIDFLLSHSQNSSSITVAFYGGEPFLEFDLIKKCIGYIESISHGRKTGFTITTNATLLNEEIIRFIVKHDISLTISLDGPKHIHDKNRKYSNSKESTYDKIIDNVNKIKKMYPEYLEKVLFNVVLDPENDISCVNDFFMNYEALLKNINVSSITDTYLKKDLKYNENFKMNFDYEIFKQLLSKVGKLKADNTSKMLYKHYQIIARVFHENRQMCYELPKYGHPGGPCIPGALRLFMDVDGNFYTCERVSESSEVMKIGDVNIGIDVDKCKKILNVATTTEFQCKNCWAFRFCHLCAAYSDKNNELSAEARLSQCNNVKYEVEKQLIEYCTLYEFNHDFDEESNTRILSYN